VASYLLAYTGGSISACATDSVCHSNGLGKGVEEEEKRLERKKKEDMGSSNPGWALLYYVGKGDLYYGLYTLPPKWQSWDYRCVLSIKPRAFCMHHIGI